MNVLFGVIVAWVLVRYSFPGRKLIDAMIDLPFALPTAVSGIALTGALYQERLDRAVPLPARIRERVFAAWHHDRARLYRLAVCGADSAASARGVGYRTRRGQPTVSGRIAGRLGRV